MVKHYKPNKPGSSHMTPADFAAGSYRATAQANPGGQELSLDFLEEQRVQAVSTMQRYSEGVARAYNRKVRTRHIALGDLVLKRATNQAALGKLDSKWEGPYVVTGKTRAGTFRIATPEGDQLGHTWNIKTL